MARARAGRAIAPLLLAAAFSRAACPTREAAALLDARRFADARKMLEPCAADDPSAALDTGRALLGEGEPDRAIASLERAAALDPKSSAAQFWLGRAFGEKAQRATVLRRPSLAGRVRRAFERSVELDPANLDARFALIEYFLRAPAILGGSAAKARAQASEIRLRDALRGYRAAGRIAELEGRPADAAAEYERAARDFPGRREPFLWRSALAFRQHDSARAFEALEAFLRAQPADAPTLFELGRLGAETGERLERAEECLKRPTGGIAGRDRSGNPKVYFSRRASARRAPACEGSSCRAASYSRPARSRSPLRP